MRWHFYLILYYGYFLSSFLKPVLEDMVVAVAVVVVAFRKFHKLVELKQWFSTLEVRRPIKCEYDHISGPAYIFWKKIGLFYTFNCVKVNKFGHLLMLLKLIRLNLKLWIRYKTKRRNVWRPINRSSRAHLLRWKAC